MYAITPKGIGNPVCARQIQPGWPLANGEAFTVEEYSPDMVLAEDGLSLRVMTDTEIVASNTPPTNDQRVSIAFSRTYASKLLFNIIFDHENRLRALEGKSAITKLQLKKALENFLETL